MELAYSRGLTKNHVTIYIYIMKLTNMYTYINTTHSYKYTQYLPPFGMTYHASIPPPHRTQICVDTEV